MRKSILSLILFCLAAAVAAAQPLMGPGTRYIYQFEPPANWKHDPQEAYEMKLNYVLRPEVVADRPNTSIITTRYPRPGGADPLAEFIKRDTDMMKKDSPQLAIKRIRLKFENLDADKVVQGRYQIYEFTIPKSEPKAVAVYIDMGEAICMLVFSTTTETLSKRYWEDYLTLVKSFQIKAMY
jgi:hypothetical protein